MRSVNKLAARTLLRALEHHLTGRSVPLMATYFATYRCNLTCPQCEVPERTADELPAAAALDLIGRLRRGGLSRIGISGGEPLVRADIGEIVRGARGMGLLVSLFTNGILLRARWEDVSDVDLVMTSLDGTPETHDAGRGPGAYAETTAAIEHARRAGKPVIGSMALTRRNIGEIDAVLGEARRLGIRMIFHPIHRYFAGDRRHADEEAGVERVRAAFELLRRRKAEGAPVLNSVPHLKYVLRRYPHGERTCYAGKLHFAILPDGTIAACPHIQRGKPAVANGEAAALPADLPRPDCADCFCYPVIGQDFLLSLRPGELLNAWNTARSLG